ncbi:winged helix-turn-helix domain-containing protein [Streptomyces sp. NPDC052077]|uniref:helix-turn-helix domain-containing protein n=1 Tax=Streptomyces sp. NPDC052077 TaxID=3154757 RepID=UPI003427A671
MWTVARVATLTHRKFRVSCSVSRATRLTHRFGFSPQIPARRVADRDERADSVRKEATRVEVEEPGRPAESTSASTTRQASPTNCSCPVLLDTRRRCRESVLVPLPGLGWFEKPLSFRK